MAGPKYVPLLRIPLLLQHAYDPTRYQDLPVQMMLSLPESTLGGLLRANACVWGVPFFS
jgi:hypothetical protein